MVPSDPKSHPRVIVIKTLASLKKHITPRQRAQRVEYQTYFDGFKATKDQPESLPFYVWVFGENRRLGIISNTKHVALQWEDKKGRRFEVDLKECLRKGGGMGLNLSGVNLMKRGSEGESYLAGANLIGAKLVGSMLIRFNLAGTYLTDAILTGATLRGAELTGADLWMANLEKTDLCVVRAAGACFMEAILTEANLTGAQLVGANLQKATLTKADLIDPCKIN